MQIFHVYFGSEFQKYFSCFNILLLGGKMQRSMTVFIVKINVRPTTDEPQNFGNIAINNRVMKKASSYPVIFFLCQLPFS